MRCRSYCEHDNDVARALNAGRAEATHRGLAPAAAYEVIERHVRRSHTASQRAQDLFGTAVVGPARVAFVPGCTGVVQRPDGTRSSHRAVVALSAAPVRVEAEACCGLPLLEAGDQAGFIAAATQFLTRLSGETTAVFEDPGCLHALRVVAPQLGAPAREGLVHLSELAAGVLERVPRAPADERSKPVRWHDPCRLGRGLGVYEEPRAVLTRLLGAAPEEMPRRREVSQCSGAGGQLPRTARATADGIADERGDEHRRSGGGLLVTGCPAAAHRFSARGIPSDTLGALLGRALDAEPEAR